MIETKQEIKDANGSVVFSVTYQISTDLNDDSRTKLNQLIAKKIEEILEALPHIFPKIL